MLCWQQKNSQKNTKKDVRFGFFIINGSTLNLKLIFKPILPELNVSYISACMCRTYYAMTVIGKANLGSTGCTTNVVSVAHIIPE